MGIIFINNRWPMLLLVLALMCANSLSANSRSGNVLASSNQGHSTADASNKSPADAQGDAQMMWIWLSPQLRKLMGVGTSEYVVQKIAGTQGGKPSKRP